jgi:hypothetical protein
MRHILKSHKKELNDSEAKADSAGEHFTEPEINEKAEMLFECGSCGKNLTTKWGSFFDS